MDKKKIALVVPSIREDSFKKFIEAWQVPITSKTYVYEVTHFILVEDNPQKSFSVDPEKFGMADIFEHFAWEDIDKELGAASWIIPRRTDCVRSFGYWKAYSSTMPKPDVIVTLDDDCYPAKDEDGDELYDFFASHVRNLYSTYGTRWFQTHPYVKPRGMPFSNRGGITTMISHGLWDNIPDMDAPSQLLFGNTPYPLADKDTVEIVPTGQFFPMCGMNLAWRAEMTPAMYFLLMGNHAGGETPWGFDRMGDIWCGLFAKKICDHLGYSVSSGAPLIEHQRASNVWKNLALEYKALEVNETLWEYVDKVILTSNTVAGSYRELAERFVPPIGNDEYWEKLQLAQQLWVDLCEEN